jgi:hypothetical protein
MANQATATATAITVAAAAVETTDAALGNTVTHCTLDMRS